MRSTDIEYYIESKAKERATGLLRKDDEYALHATPLKPVNQIKQEHYNKLVSYFKCEDLRADIGLAEELIKTAAREAASPSANQIVWEVDHALDTFLARIKEPYFDKHQTLPLQDLCGVSNDSLIAMFEQAQVFMDRKRYTEAKALLTYLTVLAPRIASFWIALGVCFENLNDNGEALVSYQVAKAISPDDPQPYLCAALCSLKMNETDKAKQELSKAEPLVMSSPSREEWMRVVQLIKIKLNRGD